ncbi:MAG: alcohol dehydrogenase catalytic domain-containing protein [Lachnoclostridium sp.]
MDAVAICATDLEIIKNGSPALIQGGLPFNKGFTPGHEYMGTIVKLQLELMSIKLVIVLRLRFMLDATVVKDVAKECILLV